MPPATAGRIVISSPSSSVRVEAVAEADVLAADVDVHEAAQLAVLGDPVAQAVEALVQRVERLADAVALDLRLGLVAGQVAQLRGDLDRHRHRAAGPRRRR